MKKRKWFIEFRKHLEYSQRELADEIGASKSLIYAVEQKGYIPSEKVCVKLGNLLGFEPEFLRERKYLSEG